MSERISIAAWHEAIRLCQGTFVADPADVLALVEAVEAAHAYYAVDWNGESEERFAAALERFDFGERP